MLPISRKVDDHKAAETLYFTHYNLARLVA
jgi:hypothetical protein